MCNCKSCTFHRRIKRTKQNGSHQQKNALIDELHSLYFHTEVELNYAECVLDGTWFTAVEQLEAALEKAKKIRQEREEENVRK